MITVSLSQEEWMKMLNLLADFPFKQVAPLIQNIHQQILPQLNQSATQHSNGDLRQEIS